MRLMTLMILSSVLTMVGLCAHAQEASAPADAPAAQQEQIVDPAQLREELMTLLNDIRTTEDGRERNALQVELIRSAERLFQPMREMASSSNSEPGLRGMVIWALGERGTDATCSAVQSSNAAGGGEQLEMVVALARARCGRLYDLRQMLSADEPILQVKAALMLGVLNDRESLSRIQRLSETGPAAPYAALMASAQAMLGDREHREEMLELLKVRQLRNYAAIALGRWGDDIAIYDLRAAVRSDEAIIRHAALTVMVEQVFMSVCNLIDDNFDDPDQRIATMRQEAERIWSRRGESYDYICM